MNASLKPNVIGPPKLIPSMVDGFNSVASHVWLILPPVILDLFLWFGPRLSLKDLLMPVIARISAELNTTATATTEMVAAVQATREIWEKMAANSNLLSGLRSYPIGIPSLMSAMGSVANPIGEPLVQQVTEAGLAIAIFILLTVVGIILGSIYLELISRAVAVEKTRFDFLQAVKATSRTLLLTVMIYAVLLGAGIPLMIVVGMISLFNASVGQIVMLVGGLFLIWMAMPMVFSAHGIFISREKVLPSVMTSIRLVRYFLPSTGMFILTALLVSQGLNMLWMTAPQGSWLILVSILGHAFISTALFSSSFVYYQGGLRWMKARTEPAQPVSTTVT
jgi:hypothetical protein